MWDFATITQALTVVAIIVGATVSLIRLILKSELKELFSMASETATDVSVLKGSLANVVERLEKIEELGHKIDDVSDKHHRFEIETLKALSMMTTRQELNSFIESTSSSITRLHARVDGVNNELLRKEAG